LEDTLPEDGWGPLLSGFELEGTRDGKPVREQVVPGSPREAELIFHDAGSLLTSAQPPARYADGSRFIVYRLPFDRETRATLRIDIGNHYRLLASGLPPDRERAFTQGEWEGPRDLWRTPLNQPFVTYDDSGARVLLTDGRDALALEKRFGKGRVLFCGLPGRHFTASETGDRQVRALTRRLVEAASRGYAEQPYLKLRRGSYVVAKTFDRPLAIPGRFVDVLRAELPVVSDVQLPADRVAVLKAIEAADRPTVLHCSSCVEWSDEAPDRTRLIVSDALGVRGSCRIAAQGREIASLTGTAANGKAAEVEVRVEADTVLLRYDNRPNGLAIDVQWE
jgi:hypothetical protein